ncbi:cytochrome P450 [Lasiosphaeria ovina]|uniref:Cytochrome P450 n=1 Tax=Lasiosphaeria ovina TaxID=92902 RepID=A0AAE0K4T2_9PEZI|nr:cytochrome P450 [Lasiosphaeria ovina]
MAGIVELALEHAAPAFLVAFTTVLAYAAVKGYRARRFFYRLRQQGMPMPPWNPILGYLLALPPIIKTLPGDTQQPDAFEALCKAHETDNSIIYVDMWPFADPMLVVGSPPLAAQVCSPELDLPKPPILRRFFSPLAGGENLFTANGAEWKRSRALFNPGFSAAYVLQRTAHVVAEARVYVDVLREHARRGAVFSLDDVTSAAWRIRRRPPPPVAWHVLDNEWNLLQAHPAALAQIRAEHDAVGGDQGSAPPVPAGLGHGLPGVSLVGAHGNRYPTAGTNIWVLHSAVQRNARYWAGAHGFRPERWLSSATSDSGDDTLALLEIKITLVLATREFDVRHTYDEWDALHPAAGVKHVNGERAYQTMAGGGHPADGYPCRVSLRA